MTKQTNHDDFGDENKVKDIWWKKGKIGDRVKGTLISKKQIESQMPDKKGELMTIYELKALFGEFHDIGEDKKPLDTPTAIVEGDIVLIGGTMGIDQKMRNTKVGDIVGFKFVAENPSKTKGYNATKVVDVFFYGKDEAWLAEQEPKDPMNEKTPFDM